MLLTSLCMQKRLAKEARDQLKQAKALAAGKKVKEAIASKIGKGRGDTSFFKVTCKDNGKGMPHDDIPNMLGRVLSGTKYGLKQTRGKFGLGAKMVSILLCVYIWQQVFLHANFSKISNLYL
jgi:DNA topoisomerase-6 subunit B